MKNLIFVYIISIYFLNFKQNSRYLYQPINQRNFHAKSVFYYCNLCQVKSTNFSIILKIKKMKGQYNVSWPQNNRFDNSNSTFKQKYNIQYISNPSTTQTNGHKNPPTDIASSKPEMTATQLYCNLNNSLDDIFSKIDALKQEHVIQQKQPKVIKKLNMDVSGFPMPNLTHNQFLKGKPFPAHTIQKLKQKSLQHPHSQPKQLNRSNQDKKAVSPPTQPFLHHVNSAQDLKNNQKYQQQSPKLISKNISNQAFQTQSPQKDEKQQKNAFSKLLKTGLINMANANMKVSMQVSPDNLPEKSNRNQPSRLELIIQKQTNQTDITKKSIVFNQPVTLKDFQLGKLVGSGKFGDVHICRHKATGSLFALKKIFKSTITEYGMIVQFTRELKIHYRLNHPNIIKLYTHFDDEYHIFLIMQYAQSGILMDRLKCTQQIASRFVDQTIEAVQYLHKLKIAHRDIKPENIVLQFGSVIKLCDFGWASYYQNQMKTTFCGTLDYLSPQMKQGGQYDNSVDIWSIGVLTYELLTGNPPYRKQLMQSMKKGSGGSKQKINWNVNYPSFVSPMAQSFIRNLLKQNPEDRATLRFCSNHTFIRKYQQDVQAILLLYPEFEKLIKS